MRWLVVLVPLIAVLGGCLGEQSSGSAARDSGVPPARTKEWRWDELIPAGELRREWVGIAAERDLEVVLDVQMAVQSQPGRNGFVDVQLFWDDDNLSLIANARITATERGLRVAATTGGNQVVPITSIGRDPREFFVETVQIGPIPAWVLAGQDRRLAVQTYAVGRDAAALGARARVSGIAEHPVFSDVGEEPLVRTIKGGVASYRFGEFESRGGASADVGPFRFAVEESLRLGFELQREAFVSWYASRAEGPTHSAMMTVRNSTGSREIRLDSGTPSLVYAQHTSRVSESWSFDAKVRGAVEIHVAFADVWIRHAPWQAAVINHSQGIDSSVSLA